MKIIRAGDVDLQVLMRGDGPPILLAHGFPLDHSMWTAQFEWLKNDWRVIAPDLRNCGGSQLTLGTVSMEQMADDMNALLDALGVNEPIVFCGLSMGGYVAWQFWRKYPQRLKALVLCDTRAAADTPEQAQSRGKMIDHVLRAGTEYVAEAMLPRLFAADTFHRLPGAVEFVRTKILAASPEGVAAVVRGIASRPDFTSRLPEIAVPTLLIAGEHDVLSPPEEMQRMADLMPHSEMIVIPDAAHLPMLENAAAFNGALAQFLLRQRGG